MKNGKRIISLLLTIVLLIAMTFSVSAREYYYEDDDGYLEYYYYHQIPSRKYYSQGTVTPGDVNGDMVTGTQSIDGMIRAFGPDGALIG